MDEPTNEPRPADSRPRLVAAHTNLTPIQEAWGAYARHQLHCRLCADLDAGPCQTAALLRQAWETLTRDAFGRLAGETA
ncbi:hypothetical protein ACFY9G_23665 [Streptomyces anthocyanicus]|uniref:hypothetical protein n=1 Tax=Streptomyces anthocyanicus TaxID=68174 RepID=UPI0036E57EBE